MQQRVMGEVYSLGLIDNRRNSRHLLHTVPTTLEPLTRGKVRADSNTGGLLFSLDVPLQTLACLNCVAWSFL